MSHERKTSGLRPRVDVIIHDPMQHGHADPDEETKVPCPVCRRSLVPPAVAAAVNAALEAASEDGPKTAAR